jgi:hypothetical protein
LPGTAVANLYAVGPKASRRACARLAANAG